ncbi:hypothetical protein ACFYMO_30770 [Streptomyces sp. NPDC007025]|uniref:hypothetical protein n=1 Tax=Streptomyces sp. NPDC007025 TaxID=3364771 RepID=UPI0036A4CC39
MENPADAKARTSAAGGLALRAEGKTHSPSTPNSKKRSNSGASARPAYGGPQMSMTAQIYAVLEPVHWLLARVGNPFVERKIAREVGRQLRAGMDAERLRHRLTARFAAASPSQIRDAGRWLLGVALPRWGCGHWDCESGVLWSSGQRCAVCQDIVADRRRARRLEQGLCPEHGTKPGTSGACPDCELQAADEDAAAALSGPRELEGPPRGSCGECGCRIFLTGRALEDGLCKACRQEAGTSAAVGAAQEPQHGRCAGLDGVPCGRPMLPSRLVCVRHRAAELTAAPCRM